MWSSSRLGPILFTLFIATLGEFSRTHGTDFQSYADDQQNCLSLKSSNTKPLAKCKESLQACITDIHKRIRTNTPKFNDNKRCPVLALDNTWKSSRRITLLKSNR